MKKYGLKLLATEVRTRNTAGNLKDYWGLHCK